jgi:hypothetical protein
MNMGFSEECATVSLLHCNNDVERAIDFALAHLGDMERLVDEYKKANSKLVSTSSNKHK